MRRGRLRYFPVVPGRAEFAEAVRRALLEEKPQVLAVELPTTLESAFLRAVDRLPELSVVLYEDEEEDRAVYLPVEVSDPFVEALRTARELGAATVFLDPDTIERPHLRDHYPDSYAVRRIGIDRYVDSYRLFPQAPGRVAAAHAEGLAWKLQGCDPAATIFIVVSLNALDPLLEAMERPQAQPLKKVRRRGVQSLNLHPQCLGETLVEMPFLQAVYERRRSGEAAVGTATAGRRRQRAGLEVLETPAADVKAAALRRSASREVFDRQRLHLDLFGGAKRLYHKNAGETVQPWQRRLWARFTRNLALLERRLLPDLYDLTVAARSIIDDNFAWETWDLANYYPYQKEQSDLATVKLSGEQVWLDSRRLLLRPRRQSAKARRRPVGLKERPKERHPGEWKKEWRGSGICSYPPEDLVIENYGAFLKKKGKAVLSEERSRVEPFATSLLDGVDLRETLRNWHVDGRVYVRENQKIAGEVGAVVIIFDEDREDRYPYCITWLGEHQNESDMAFYATNPFENIVGPGIGRAEYGGLLLSLPPQRMMDVWTDWDYAFAQSKPERLLLAALDYSLEKIIVYLGPRPPRSIFRSIAARLGRKIVYIPIGQVSPVALKKMRVMHVLDGHDRRSAAKQYIW